MNNDINEIVNKMYYHISQRILNKKRQLKKTRTDITSDNNIQLLSSIMHNKRVQNRNPYLLNPSITQDIVSSLQFPSSYELIWGKKEDLASFFGDGINYLKSQEGAKSNTIKKCLHEYLPFAKVDAQYNNSHFTSPSDEQVREELSLVASSYLYACLHNDFEQYHYEFFKDKGTKKLNKWISLFFDTELFKLLKQFLKDNDDHGEKIYQLIKNIINYENEYLFDDMIYGAEGYFHLIATNSEEPIQDIRSEIISAGEKYIDTIIEAQEKTDPFFL